MKRVLAGDGSCFTFCSLVLARSPSSSYIQAQNRHVQKSPGQKPNVSLILSNQNPVTYAVLCPESAVKGMSDADGGCCVSFGKTSKKGFSDWTKSNSRLLVMDGSHEKKSTWCSGPIVHPSWKWWKGDACGAAGYAVLKKSTNLSALQYEIAIYRLM